MPFIYHGTREKCILHMLVMLMQLEPNTEHEHTIELRCVCPERNDWVLVDTFHFSREGDYCSKGRSRRDK